ncbi:LysR family transcriptional regulator [Marinobacterium ramblicola]|uniref:LysR family transcriptional regulator n=1 Tax=Marinobacterium ramblicola TaxID=2849041 RepID=UPI001C2DA739
MSVNYQDLYYFIKVVEKGSLVAAAKYLDIPTSTLSRRMQAFEQELGYKLIHRSAKKFGLTESGQRFYSSLSGVITELETRVEDVNSELSSLSGDIKVTAPVSFGHYYVKEWVFEFMEQNPKISVEMFLSNENVDLVKNSIDIAFRLGEVTLNDWVSRSLFDSAMVMCAKPSLIEQFGEPRTPEDLARLPLIVLKRTAFWRFHDRDGHAVTYTPKAHLRTDEIMFAKEAVKRGIGAACLPRYVVNNALESGEIRSLLDDWSLQSKPVQIMYPHRESLPVKTRAFIDFVIDKVRESGY